MFSHHTVFNSELARILLGKAVRLIDEIKSQRINLESEPFRIYVHSATEDWTYKAWGELKMRILEALKKDISGVYPERGNKFLLTMLNEGVLGLYFRTRNEITLVGPGFEAIRRSWNSNKGFHIGISKNPLIL